MTSLTKTQKRLKILFTNHAREDGYIFDEDFRNDVELLRELGVQMLEGVGDSDSPEGLPPIVGFMQQYEFPSNMLRFVTAFILENRVDFSLIESGMFIVSEADKTSTGIDEDLEGNYRTYIDISTMRGEREHRPELKLVISPNASINEIKDLIDQHWSTFIKPKQQLYKHLVTVPEIIRERKSAEIHHEATNLRREGYTYSEIAQLLKERFGVDYPYKEVQRIVERLKKSKL